MIKNRSSPGSLALPATGLVRVLKLAQASSSTGKSPRLGITPQDDLARPFSTKWGIVDRVGTAGSPYTDHHFRVATHERKGCIALRAEPVAIIGELSSAPPPVRRTVRWWEQEQSALTELAKLAMARGVGALSYHGGLLKKVDRTNNHRKVDWRSGLDTGSVRHSSITMWCIAILTAGAIESRGESTRSSYEGN
jgi:hypothetical protein